MARRNAVTISLGEQTFDVRPLTVSQVEEIEGVLKEQTEPGVKQAGAILAVALSRDYGDVDLNEVEATLPDLVTAMGQILKHGEFIGSGEPQAAAGNAPSGKTSRGGSPQSSARHPKR